MGYKTQSNQSKLQCIECSVKKLVGNITKSGTLARKLEKLGYKGRVNKYTSCPIARYVSDQCGFPVSVSGDRIWPTRTNQEYWAPRVIFEFVCEFDTHTYPYLEEK